jgi:outer membrane phospholipase A
MLSRRNSRPKTAGAARSEASNSESKTKRPATGRKSKKTKTKPCNVKVVVRARPPSAQENADNNPQVVSTIGMSEVALRYKSTRRLFTFDRVYSQYSSQEEVYSFSVKPMVEEVLNGFNCTVFA